MTYPRISTLYFCLVLLVLSISFTTAWADEQNPSELSGCDAFDAELAGELDLLAKPDAARKAAIDPAGVGSVALQTGVAHALVLTAPAEVSFVIVPQREQAAESYGGMAAFTAPETGTWRVAISRRAWIDAIHAPANAEASAIASTRHGGRGDCALMHKFVEFPLAVGETYVVQISGSPEADINAVVTGPWPESAKP